MRTVPTVVAVAELRQGPGGDGMGRRRVTPRGEGALVAVAAPPPDAGSVAGDREVVAPTGAGVVAVLCPRAWGVRNVVHSGMLGQLRERGLDVCLVTSLADVALAADEWGSQVRCVELFAASRPGKGVTSL